ncbi:hypothetical protein Pcinc_014639 [Petrolisthes cinctipes]|uniref:Protein DEK n=1 Tax=Petrolisthes cinctipes TaxID=88211 RepID=A0AAE1KT18_PETCI|nr:hypothetical protein Pcinc_014639 [Petrolisthes cinctipes]
MAEEDIKAQVNEDQKMEETEEVTDKVEKEVKVEEKVEEKTEDNEEQNDDDEGDEEKETQEENMKSVKPKKPKEEKQKEKETKEKPTEVVKTTTKDHDVPLYDQPLEKSGKRDRKKVERYEEETKKEEEVKPAGNGVSFGDIPYINAMITKLPMDELKILHRVAYGRPGSGVSIKRNLRKFNGYPFDKDDKKYQAKLSAVETRIRVAEIKKVLKVLGVEQSGTKAEMVERLMAFMLLPKDEGRAPPKASTGQKRPRKGPKKKQGGVTSAADSVSSGGDTSDDIDDKDEVEVKKSGGRGKSKGTPSRRGGGGVGRGRGAKRARPAPVSDSDSESDDEPLAKKKAKQPPTDAELKVMVKKILDGANLEEVTMKSVCRQVYESYPDFDLTHKKLFIKETVKSIIS